MALPNNTSSLLNPLNSTDSHSLHNTTPSLHQNQSSNTIELQTVIGVNGKLKNGFILHPNDQHIIYTLGATVVIRHLHTNQQSFLTNPSTSHTSITCLSLSSTGKYLATGNIEQVTSYLATITVWDIEEFQILYELKLHKGSIGTVEFSSDEQYLASIGGKDDNRLVIWSLKDGQPLAGSIAANDTATLVKWVNSPNISVNGGGAVGNGTIRALVTAGNYTLRYWLFHSDTRRITPQDAILGQIKRIYTSLVVVPGTDMNSQIHTVYAGTQSGDILECILPTVSNTYTFALKRQGPVNTSIVSKDMNNPHNHTVYNNNEKISTHNYTSVSNTKKPFSLGVTSMILSKKGNLIVGTGDGVVGVVIVNKINTKEKDSKDKEKECLMKISKTTKLTGGITSLALNASGDHFFVATSDCNIYCTAVSDLQYELRFSSHKHSITCIKFPHNYSELFITGGGSEIRVWQLKTAFELLRITVPNLIVTSLCFSLDGTKIISGWNDGTIRVFTPQTGKAIGTITDANPGGVTALSTFQVGGGPNSNNTSHPYKHLVISGGEQGHIRIWQLQPNTTGTTSTLVSKMLYSLKEHKARVNSIDVASDNTEFVSASNDGSCIVWECQRFTRKLALVSATQFTSAAYHPSAVQLVTGGVDRKLSYWDVSDGQLIRVIDGAHNDQITGIQVTSEGGSGSSQTSDWLVSVGNDHVVKVWHYDEGQCYYTGSGNTGNINGLAVSPNQQYIVSVGSDGAIFVYQHPAYNNQPAALSPTGAQQGITQKVNDENVSHLGNSQESDALQQNVSQLSLSGKLSTTSNTNRNQDTARYAPLPQATTHRTRTVLR